MAQSLAMIMAVKLVSLMVESWVDLLDLKDWMKVEMMAHQMDNL